MIYGYCRVRTKGTLKGCLNLEEQEALLKEHGAVKIYKDEFSGSKGDKPEFDKLMQILKKDDVFMITKLDRITRSILVGYRTIENLFDRGVKVHILDIGVIENTFEGQTIKRVLSSLSDFEKNMIIETTQEGKMIARTKEGFKEGRGKKFTQEQLDEALKMLSVRGGNYSYAEVSKKTNISIGTLTREVRRRKLIVFKNLIV